MAKEAEVREATGGAIDRRSLLQPGEQAGGLGPVLGPLQGHGQGHEGVDGARAVWLVQSPASAPVALHGVGRVQGQGAVVGEREALLHDGLAQAPAGEDHAHVALGEMGDPQALALKL